MNNYENKYLKYKLKYLELKSLELKGGSDKAVVPSGSSQLTRSDQEAIEIQLLEAQRELAIRQQERRQTVISRQRAYEQGTQQALETQQTQQTQNANFVNYLKQETQTLTEEEKLAEETRIQEQQFKVFQAKLEAANQQMTKSESKEEISKLAQLQEKKNQFLQSRINKLLEEKQKQEQENQNKKKKEAEIEYTKLRNKHIDIFISDPQKYITKLLINTKAHNFQNYINNRNRNSNLYYEITYSGVLSA